MPRPKKSIEDTWYDCFCSWTLDDQRAALKVLEQLHRQKQRDARYTQSDNLQQNHYRDLRLSLEPEKGPNETR